MTANDLRQLAHCICDVAGKLKGGVLETGCNVVLDTGKNGVIAACILHLDSRRSYKNKSRKTTPANPSPSTHPNTAP